MSQNRLKAPFLFKLTELIESYLNESWAETIVQKLNIPEGTDLENYTPLLEQILSFTSEFSRQLSLYLNLSIIDGEFINDSESEEFVKNLKRTIEQGAEQLSQSQLTLDQQQKFYALFDYAVYSLNLYHQLISILRKKLDTSGREILIDRKSIQQVDEVYKIDIDTLYWNCQSTADDLLPSTKKLQSLIQIETSCLKAIESNLYNNSILKVISDKAQFLKNKILNRFEKDESDNSFLILSDFDLSELHADKIPKDNLFSDFNITTINHYGIVNDNKWRRQKLEKTDIKIGNDLKLSRSDYHFRIKYYKDTKKDVNQLQNLLDNFEHETEKEKIDSTFNLNAQIICKGYLKNNLFSLEIDNGQNKYEKIKDSYNELVRMQKDSGIRNYFLHQKFCTHISTLLKDSREQYSLEDCTNLLKDFKLAVKGFKNDLEWCEARNFIPFQLPFNECGINKELNIDGETVTPKLFSSFVIPLDYNKIFNKYHELKELEEELIAQNTERIILESKRKQIADFIKAAEKNETKYIEILGIFSAVALFGIGSIKFFDNGEPLEINHVLLFMITFALSMASFIALIKLILARARLRFWFALLIIYLIALTFLIIELGKNNFTLIHVGD